MNEFPVFLRIYVFWKKPGMKVTNARSWQLKPLFTELPVILPDTQLHYVAWMELYSPAE